MLTGSRLFSGETVNDILVQLLNSDPHFEAVPIRFQELLRRYIERDPRKRLRDIGDARLLLEGRLLDQHPCHRPAADGRYC